MRQEKHSSLNVWFCLLSHPSFMQGYAGTRQYFFFSVLCSTHQCLHTSRFEYHPKHLANVFLDFDVHTWVPICSLWVFVTWAKLMNHAIHDRPVYKEIMHSVTDFSSLKCFHPFTKPGLVVSGTMRTGLLNWADDHTLAGAQLSGHPSQRTKGLPFAHWVV